MIFLNIEIDNIYLYENFSMDFSYERKLVNNSIENEWLSEYPNFKYRKVNILMGANASGKTTLGKVMMGLQNFISKGSEVHLPFDKIKNKKKQATISTDFYNEGYLYRYTVKFNQDSIKSEKIEHYQLKKNDSYKTARSKLKLVSSTMYKGDNGFSECTLKNFVPGFGWYYTFAMISDESGSGECSTKILEMVLKGYDNTIKSVKAIPNSTNSFNIVFKNGDNILVQNGKVLDKDRISAGTYESIRVATTLSSLNQQRNYYIDENLVHSHTELEQEILNYMIYILPKDSQLFFTTHNTDVLDMNLPIHSFQFLKNNKGKFEAIDPSQEFKQNDRKLRNYVENDVFKTLPDTEFIERLYEVE